MINQIKKIISSFLISTEYISPFTLNLKNKVILVTGASRGIGKAISEVLYREGAQLILISRDIESLKNTDDDLYNSDRVLLINANISEETDVVKIKNIIEEEKLRIDVLINNAGQFADKAIEELSVSEYKKVIDTNIFGVFLMSRMVTPFMKKQKNGFIINIGSKISHNTNVAPHKVLYAMSKYAVEGFSFALNKELKEFGIRVSCLMPGTVNTFVSLKSKEYLSPYDIANLILMMIKFDKIDFEAVIAKSVKQNI